MQKLVHIFYALLLIPCVATAQTTQRRSQLQAIMQQYPITGMQLQYNGKNRTETYYLGTIADGVDKSVTAATVFEAASLSKPVFAYAVLRLYDRGLINIDTPLLHYIGIYPRFNAANAAYAKITARMVMRHTTGLPNWGDSASVKLLFTPDSCFSYSGEGYVLLQKAVEKITGMQLDDVVRQEVFNPLHMYSSSYTWRSMFDTAAAFGNSADAVKRHTAQNAAYSLLTNAHDYSLFIQAVLQGTGLQPQTHTMMITKTMGGHWFNHKVVPADAHIGWGLGIGIQENEKGKALWHWGDNGGFKAFCIMWPAAGESLVYFAHSYYGLFMAQEITDLFFGKQNAWAVQWMEESYNDAYIMKDLAAALRQQGVSHAAAVADSLEKSRPGTIITQSDLNDWGFMLLRQKRLQEAIAVFALNIKRHPDSGDAYDSIAEAYDAAGEKQLALQNFKRCVELDPQNKFAAGQVKKLEGK